MELVLISLLIHFTAIECPIIILANGVITYMPDSSPEFWREYKLQIVTITSLVKNVIDFVYSSYNTKQIGSPQTQVLKQTHILRF